MADIDYPSGLPGVLVNSNSYQPQDVVRRNDLQSGPPIFRLDSEDEFCMFDVAWSFNALENQVFRNFHKSITGSGSKLFNIELWVDGDNGVKQTRTHEVYFVGTPKYTQNKRRWSVSASLLAIEQILLSEEDAISLIEAFNVFIDGLDAGILSLNEVIETLEELWQP